MDSSDSSDDNGDTNNIKNIYNGVPMLVLEHRYAFLRLKKGFELTNYTLF